MIQHQCPHCGEQLANSLHMEGMTIACRGCKEQIRVPNYTKKDEQSSGDSVPLPLHPQISAGKQQVWDEGSIVLRRSLAICICHALLSLLMTVVGFSAAAWIAGGDAKRDPKDKVPTPVLYAVAPGFLGLGGFALLILALVRMSDREPKLILTNLALVDQTSERPRSIPWHQINRVEVEYYRRGDTGKITLTVLREHGEEQVVLDVSWMDRDPKDIFKLLKKYAQLEEKS